MKDKENKYLWIKMYRSLNANKNITDLQFCLYGYLKTLINNKNKNSIVLDKRIKNDIKKVFNYRYYYLSEDEIEKKKTRTGKKDKCLLNDIVNLHKEKIITLKIENKENFIESDWTIYFNETEDKFTMIPNAVFQKVMPELKDYRAIRFLCYLISFQNINTAKTTVHPSYNQLMEDICKRSPRCVSRINDLLESYQLIYIDVGRIKQEEDKDKNKKNTFRNFHNKYQILINNIINFNPKKKISVTKRKNKRKIKRSETLRQK